MLGNFKYSNPTKLYFGGDSLNNLKEERQAMERMYSLFMVEVLSRKMVFMIR